jgi:hypothetical protein
MPAPCRSAASPESLFMHPIHDVDVLLLLACSLAAKRRPAETTGIMAAIDLVQGNIPAEEKLVEAFARLGRAGLLIESEGGVALTPAAEDLIRILPRKGENDQRLFELRGLLGAYQPATEGVEINIAGEALRAAMLAHRASAVGAGKNLLVPKPKPEAAKARPGQRQRKPMPKQRKR